MGSGLSSVDLKRSVPSVRRREQDVVYTRWRADVVRVWCAVCNCCVKIVHKWGAWSTGQDVRDNILSVLTNKFIR